MSSASTVQARMPARVYDRTREDVHPRPAEPPRSLRRAARETSRAPLAPPAGLFLPLLGHRDEHPLAALGRPARAPRGAPAPAPWWLLLALPLQRPSVPSACISQAP